MRRVLNLIVELSNSCNQGKFLSERVQKRKVVIYKNRLSSN